jgi:hypothetical protein
MLAHESTSSITTSPRNLDLSLIPMEIQPAQGAQYSNPDSWVVPRCDAFHANLSPSTERTLPTFPFLSLPAELRNIIYEYIFSDILVELDISLKHDSGLSYPHHCYTLSSSTYRSGPISQFQDTIGLLYVCRQIYVEARAFPIALSAFSISNGRKLYRSNVKHSSLVGAIRTLRIFIYIAHAKGFNMAYTVPESTRTKSIWRASKPLAPPREYINLSPFFDSIM